MLSDEEKEALDKLSSKKNETTWDDTIRQIKREEIRDVVVTRQKYITSILNIIEKQSKEIEELKEINKEIGKALDEWINGERTSIFHIHKDKIKAKIEEIDNEYSNKILSNDKMSLDLVNINTQRHNAMKLVLEELLEKE